MNYGIESNGLNRMEWNGMIEWNGMNEYGIE